VHYDILTLFPGMFEGPFRESMLKRAAERGLISIAVHNIRDFAQDRHRTTDDYPFGGGTGMVMKPEPIFAAVEHVLALRETPPSDWPADTTYVPHGTAVIVLTPSGRLLNQSLVQEIATFDHLVLICGRYEGIDDRVYQHLVTHEVSIGDYVLTGGEIPAMVVVDTVSRLVPGVLPVDAPLEESHAEGLLEYPQYTRPADFRGWSVPAILTSGHHAEVARWRRCQSLWRTRERRPDLLASKSLSKEDRRLLEAMERALEEGREPCE
jgi:tRNA (guanine37-N1)-methyltransferase